MAVSVAATLVNLREADCSSLSNRHAPGITISEMLGGISLVDSSISYGQIKRS